MGTGRAANVGASNSLRETTDDDRRQQQQNNSVQSVSTDDTNNVQNKNSPHYKLDQSAFSKMSVSDAANFLNSLNSDISDSDVRALNLNSSNFYQKTLLSLGLNDKPVVLSDADFDNLAKTESATPILYRGLGSGTSAVKAVDQTKFGDLSWAAGGIHGCGVAYLTSRHRYATMYGYGKSANGDTGFVSYLDKSATKMVTETKLRSLLRNESSQVQHAFRGYSGLSSYALYKGYNCIHVPKGNGGTNDGDFYVPLTRSIMVIREHAT